MRAPTILIATLAALALGAGCGGDEETTTSSTTVEPTTTAATGPTGPAEGTTTREDGETTGGGDAPDTGAGSDPEDALREFFTSGDPDLVCGELATEELIASAYGDERGCRQAQVPAALPDSIEIVKLEESVETTEAVVVPRGGPNDGFDHEVVLIREGDAWLVDSLEADIPAGP